MQQGTLREARRRLAGDHGAPEAPMMLDAGQVPALHEAVACLEQEDPQAAEVTRLRFFSGLSKEETAQAMGLSVRSVYLECSYAPVRLFEMLGENG